LKPYKCITTLSRLSYILSWWKCVRMAMLSKQDHNRTQVASSTHEISEWCSLMEEWLVIKLISTLI
jgi:hypothetical protein